MGEFGQLKLFWKKDLSLLNIQFAPAATQAVCYNHVAGGCLYQRPLAAKKLLKKSAPFLYFGGVLELFILTDFEISENKFLKITDFLQSPFLRLELGADFASN